jgi:hypothetical protein
MFTYNGKDFTFGTDHLPALVNVVRWNSKKCELTPSLGLWHETLNLDLGWQSIVIDCEGARTSKFDVSRTLILDVTCFGLS